MYKMNEYYTSFFTMHNFSVWESFLRKNENKGGKVKKNGFDIFQNHWVFLFLLTSRLHEKSKSQVFT